MADIAQVREYADGELVPGTHYRVVRMLGAGGMGCVYEVEHVELERRFVLKSLLKSLANREDLVARMRKEWRALAKVSHENVVDISYAGTSASGAPYYVMELLVGETLSRRLRRLERLPWPEAARIAREILLGLAVVHRLDVVHRDIKPANIFVTEDETVKVLDFGIAKVRDDSVGMDMTAAGLAIGTPRYMSPEQVAGDPTTAQSDLYAVGLLLFEMIAGQGPFNDLRNQTEQMLAHVSRKPASLSEHATIPPEIDDLVARALAKRPADRPGSAEAMAESLARFAGPRRKGAWEVKGAAAETPEARTAKEGEHAEPSASIPSVGLRSDEPTLAHPAPFASSPQSKSTTLPESSFAQTDAATAFDESAPNPRTEQLSLAPTDAFRDETTRTSVSLRRSPDREAAGSVTPPPVHTLTPANPPASLRRGGFKLLAMAAMGSLTALTLLSLSLLSGADSSPEPSEAAAAAPLELPTVDLADTSPGPETTVPALATLEDEALDEGDVEKKAEVLLAAEGDEEISPPPPELPRESRTGPQLPRTRPAGKAKRGLPGSGL